MLEADAGKATHSNAVVDHNVLWAGIATQVTLLICNSSSLQVRMQILVDSH
jgi:hypothetical protein